MTTRVSIPVISVASLQIDERYVSVREVEEIIANGHSRPNQRRVQAWIDNAVRIRRALEQLWAERESSP